MIISSLSDRPAQQCAGVFHYRNAWYRHIFTIPAEDEESGWCFVQEWRPMRPYTERLSDRP